MAIDEAVETMPNMSPSWTSSSEIFLNNSRTPGVAEVEVQVVDEDEEEDAARRIRRRAGGSRMPSATGAGGGAAML